MGDDCWGNPPGSGYVSDTSGDPLAVWQEKIDSLTRDLTHDLASARSALAEREKEIERLKAVMLKDRSYFGSLAGKAELYDKLVGYGADEARRAVEELRLQRDELVEALRPFAREGSTSFARFSWDDIEKARALVGKYGK